MDAEGIEKLLTAVNSKPIISTEVDTAADLAPFAFVPNGYSVKSLREFQQDPERVKQRVALLTAADFIAYWKRFSDDSSVVFGDERRAVYTAIIDYHGSEGIAAWTDHQAVYACPFSPEWQIWIGQDRKPKTQLEFARFIEDNLIDIIRPASADMLQVSLNLQAKKAVSFSSSTRLSDGETQFAYSEEIKGSADSKAGTLKVPDDFEIAVPVFIGGKTYAITARLRYRIEDGGKLVMWYELVRPHKVLEAATQEVTSVIRAGIGEASARMFLGAAGS